MYFNLVFIMALTVSSFIPVCKYCHLTNEHTNTLYSYCGSADNYYKSIALADENREISLGQSMKYLQGCIGATPDDYENCGIYGLTEKNCVNLFAVYRTEESDTTFNLSNFHSASHLEQRIKTYWQLDGFRNLW